MGNRRFHLKTSQRTDCCGVVWSVSRQYFDPSKPGPTINLARPRSHALEAFHGGPVAAFGDFADRIEVEKFDTPKVHRQVHVDVVVG